MFKFVSGNILESNAEAIVNPVNLVGVMGKGLALAFKQGFPVNFKLYQKAYQNNQLEIGKMFVTETGKFLPKYIINFPTKKHWREYSKIEYIIEGLHDLHNLIINNKIESIAMPPLGCGNGGLNWSEVKPLILDKFDNLSKNVDIVIYEPGFANKINQVKKDVQLNPQRAMLLYSLDKYLILGYDINLLVAQKIAYFIERLGETLNLKYEKGYYGPYSNRLQHLLRYLNGSFLTFDNFNTNPNHIVNLKNSDKVQEYVKTNLNETQTKRLNILLELIEGFESPYGLELLATIDFIIQRKQVKTLEDVSENISNWTKRKKEIMKSYHIKVAYNRINKFYDKRLL